jgi:branched-chain amino acid transport system ATP-binding protein
MQKEILLKTDDLHVRYGGVTALNGADIALDEGEVVALMGPNGAGKSTILKAVFGIAPIHHGKVLWREVPVSPVSYEMVERGIAFVPQGRRVFTDLTVEENLEVGGYVVRDSRLVKERIHGLMEMFPVLREKRKAKSGTLSGGQQQMLAIARGLMTDPKVLLLDEPSLGLSPKVVKEVFAFVKDINQKRKTAVLVVEHNIKSLLEIADRGYILDKGRVIAEGDPKRLVSEGVLQKVFSGAM